MDTISYMNTPLVDVPDSKRNLSEEHDQLCGSHFAIAHKVEVNTYQRVTQFARCLEFLNDSLGWYRGKSDCGVYGWEPTISSWGDVPTAQAALVFGVMQKDEYDTVEMPPLLFTANVLATIFQTNASRWFPRAMSAPELVWDPWGKEKSMFVRAYLPAKGIWSNTAILSLYAKLMRSHEWGLCPYQVRAFNKKPTEDTLQECFASADPDAGYLDTDIQDSSLIEFLARNKVSSFYQSMKESMVRYPYGLPSASPYAMHEAGFLYHAISRDY